MFKIIAVTDRTLCTKGKGAFLQQIEKITGSGINAIILREKDLAPKEYGELALVLKPLCSAHNVELIAHSFMDTAQKTGLALHLPWSLFAGLTKKQTARLINFGVSVHSPEEAGLAIKGGALWLIAGHIYPVKSKGELQARGTEFLSCICRMSPVPVYGIGGINNGNIREIAASGAGGACLMSSIMLSQDPHNLVKDLLEKIK